MERFFLSFVMVFLLFRITTGHTQINLGDNCCFMPENRYYSHKEKLNRFTKKDILSYIKLKKQIFDSVAHKFLSKKENIIIESKMDVLKVNARAFVAYGKKYIHVYAGIICHEKVFYEGMALIIAHEVVHHTIERDTRVSPDGTVNCDEVECDYFAVTKIIPEVFGESNSFRIIDKGINQIDELFKSGYILESFYEKNRGCVKHAPDDCRIQIFKQGLSKTPSIPLCVKY